MNESRSGGNEALCPLVCSPKSVRGIVVVAAAGAFGSIPGSDSEEHTYSTGTAKTGFVVLCGCTRASQSTRDAGQSLETLSVVTTRDRVFLAPREARDARSTLPHWVAHSRIMWPERSGRSLEEGTRARALDKLRKACAEFLWRPSHLAPHFCACFSKCLNSY